MDPNNINHYMIQAMYAGYLREDRDDLNATLGDEDSVMSGVDRRNMAGHFVASAIVFNLKHDRVLMIQHRTLQKLLFPGGHIDAGEDALIAAFREVSEETGIYARPVFHYPIDIDTHPIPANPAKNEGEHVHHDLLFVGRTTTNQRSYIKEDEVEYAVWIPFHELPNMGERNARVHERLKAWAGY